MLTEGWMSSREARSLLHCRVGGGLALVTVPKAALSRTSLLCPSRKSSPTLQLPPLCSSLLASACPPFVGIRAKVNTTSWSLFWRLTDLPSLSVWPG